MKTSGRTRNPLFFLPLILIPFIPALSSAETASGLSTKHSALGFPVHQLRYIPDSALRIPNSGFRSFVNRQSAIGNQQEGSDWVSRSLSEDRWIALDKLAHLLVSFSLVGIGFAVSSERGLGLSRNQARILSAGGTALIGLAKEIRDYRKGAGFSGKDLAADGLGIALGVLVFTF